MPPKIAIIVAVDEKNAIGANNNLLCYLPNDLKHFKQITQGHTVIMGRKTFESLPGGALPKRRNVVITRNQDLHYLGCEMATSLQQAISLCADDDLAFIIGGGTIYKEAINIADELYLTRIHHIFDDADTFFPQIDKLHWQLDTNEPHEIDDRHQFSYSFQKFIKK